MKNITTIISIFIATFSISYSSAARHQVYPLTKVESSFHGKSKEVMDLFKDFPDGMTVFMAQPESDGLKIEPHPDHERSDAFSDEIKTFLQQLLDEVNSNQLAVAANARITVVKYSTKPSELSARWHVDGLDSWGEIENSPRTFISFSNSQGNLSTRFSALTPPVAPEDYNTLGDHLVRGVEEGDFASGDMHFIYHRGPTPEEMGSSQRVIIIFDGKVYEAI